MTKEAQVLSDLRVVKEYFDRNYLPLELNTDATQRAMIKQLNEQITEACNTFDKKVEQLRRNDD